MAAVATTLTQTKPKTCRYLRNASERIAVEDLTQKISPEVFMQTFGAPSGQALSLLEGKALTLSKLMVLAPPGTLDPSPHLYDSTMYTLGGVMGVATLAHAMVKPLPASPLVIDVPAVEVSENQAQVDSK